MKPMTDYTPEELAEYYKGALERIVRIAPGLTLEAFETNEGRDCYEILAGPPPQPKWIAGDTTPLFASIHYTGRDAPHKRKIEVRGKYAEAQRDAIIDFLNKREEG